MKTIAIGIAAVVALIGTPGLAADTASAYSWTGFYAGPNIGLGWGNQNVSYTPNDVVSRGLMLDATNGLGVFNPTSFINFGAIGGFQVGYNWQFQRNWLVGLETDFDFSGIQGSSTEAAINFNTLPISTLASEQVNWFGTIRARLGYLPTDNLLTYVTGGFAYGSVSESGNFALGPGGSFGATVGNIGYTCNEASVCFAGSSNYVVPGWTVGAGLEFAAYKNVTLKAEYLFISLNGRSITETALNAGGPNVTPSTFNAGFGNTVINVVRVGFNYRF